MSAEEHASAGAVRLEERLALRPAEAAAALGISERKFRQMIPRLRCVVRDGGVVLILPDLLREDLHRLAAESPVHDEELRARAGESASVKNVEAEQFALELRAKAAARRARR